MSLPASPPDFFPCKYRVNAALAAGCLAIRLQQPGAMQPHLLPLGALFAVCRGGRRLDVKGHGPLGLGLFVLDIIFEDRFGFQTALLWIKGILT